MIRNNFRVLACAVVSSILLLVFPSRCAANPVPLPKGTVNLGFFPPTGEQKHAVLAQDVFEEILASYGYEVQLLESIENEWEAVANQPGLDFSIKLTLGTGVASVRVFDYHRETVRRMESHAENPIRDLAAKVLRHVSSESSIEGLVATRREIAIAALARNPEDFQSLFLMGMAYYHELDYRRALKYFRQALEIEPTDADTHYGLALCHEGLDESTKAVEHLSAALNLDPHHESASIALANAHLKLDRFNEAISVYNRWLESPQNSALAHWNLAVAFNRKGSQRETLAHLSEITRNDPQYERAQRMILELSDRGVTRDEQAVGSSRFSWIVIGAGGGVLVLLLAASAAVFMNRRHRSSANTGESDTHLVNEVDDTIDFVAPANGHEIGDYQLEEKIGRGGMGMVFRAKHRHLDKIVAIKLIGPKLLANPDAIERFRREMRAVGRLDHPGIVRATDAGEDRGQYYLVMDYVEGLDLSHLVHETSRLPVSTACEIVRQAASALHYAHSQGMVHRDIKPSNMILCLDGTVKIFDFGLARLHDESQSHNDFTRAGQVIGTPDFMSPEQASGRGSVDARSDIYSLGCTFYALLTGSGPFNDPHHGTPASKVIAQIQEPIPPVKISRTDISDELVLVLDQMLAKLPADRFQSAAEVADAVTDLAAESDLSRLFTTVSLKATPART